MNVASLELCKELYELSGWIPPKQRGYMAAYPERSPSYDLGYLLRKLPRELLNHENLRLEPKNGSKTTWQCSYDYMEPYGAIADTPEDAICKLAIELFKQGVLKP